MKRFVVGIALVIGAQVAQAQTPAVMALRRCLITHAATGEYFVETRFGDLDVYASGIRLLRSCPNEVRAREKEGYGLPVTLVAQGVVVDAWKYGINDLSAWEKEMLEVNEKPAPPPPQKTIVYPPVPIVSPQPEFPPEAVRAGLQGVVPVRVTVDEHGNPQNPTVLRSLDKVLDEKALENARKYRFKPARSFQPDAREGIPVPFVLTIDVEFRIYK